MNPVDYQAAAQERKRRRKLMHDAAPDLLAALEAASAYIRKSGYTDRAEWMDVRDTIETAITKARGA